MLHRILFIGAPLTGKTTLTSALLFHGPGASEPCDAMLRTSRTLEDGSTIEIQSLEVSYSTSLPKSRREKFFRGCHAVVICFDTASRKTFEVVPHIVDDCIQFQSMPYPVYLVGCMSDLTPEVHYNEAAASFQDCRAYLSVSLHYVSALTQDLAPLFSDIVSNILASLSTPVPHLPLDHAAAKASPSSPSASLWATPPTSISTTPSIDTLRLSPSPSSAGKLRRSRTHNWDDQVTWATELVSVATSSSAISFSSSNVVDMQPISPRSPLTVSPPLSPGRSPTRFSFLPSASSSASYPVTTTATATATASFASFTSPSTSPPPSPLNLQAILDKRRDKILQVLQTPVFSQLSSSSSTVGGSPSDFALHHDRSTYSRLQVIAEELAFFLTRAQPVLSDQFLAGLEEKRRSLSEMKKVVVLSDEFTQFCTAYLQAEVFAQRNSQELRWQFENSLAVTVLHDRASHKAALNQLQAYTHAMSTLVSSRISPLVVYPLVAIVTVLGQSFLVKTLVPPSFKCVYNPDEGVSESREVEEHLKMLARRFNLLVPHWGHTDDDQLFDKRQFFSGTGVRGYARPDSDQVFYIDFNGDLFPSLGPDRLKRCRPEACIRSPVPLCPNVFHASVRLDPLLADQISSLEQTQFNSVLPRVALEIQSLPVSSAAVLAAVHRAGIRFSMLGCVHAQVHSVPHANVLLVEAVARVFEQRVVVKLQSCTAQLFCQSRKTIAHLLNKMFTQNETCCDYWIEKVAPALVAHFGFACFSNPENTRDLFFRVFAEPSPEERRGLAQQLFLTISRRATFPFADLFLQRLHLKGWKLPHSFSELDIAPRFTAKIKTSAVADFARLSLLYEQLKRTPASQNSVRLLLSDELRLRTPDMLRALPCFSLGILAGIMFVKAAPNGPNLNELSRLIELLEDLPWLHASIEQAAHYYIARYKSRLGFVDQAHDHFLAALDLDPNHAYVLRCYANFLKRFDRSLAQKFKVRSDSLLGRKSPRRDRTAQRVSLSLSKVVEPPTAYRPLTERGSPKPKDPATVLPIIRTEPLNLRHRTMSLIAASPEPKTPKKRFLSFLRRPTKPS